MRYKYTIAYFYVSVVVACTGMHASDTAKIFMKNVPINGVFWCIHKKCKQTLKNQALMEPATSNVLEELINANIIASIQACQLKGKASPLHVIGIENIAFSLGYAARSLADQGMAYLFPQIKPDSMVRSAVGCTVDCIVRSIVRSVLYTKDQARHGAVYGGFGIRFGI